MWRHWAGTLSHVVGGCGPGDGGLGVYSEGGREVASGKSNGVGRLGGGDGLGCSGSCRRSAEGLGDGSCHLEVVHA